jgi:hypothetical protein
MNHKIENLITNQDTGAYSYVKVKQSHYGPGQALMVPGG